MHIEITGDSRTRAGRSRGPVGKKERAEAQGCGDAGETDAAHNGVIRATCYQQAAMQSPSHVL